MPSVVHTCTIDCPIETVFAAVAAVEEQPRWNPSVRSVRRVDAGPVARGSRFMLEVRGFSVGAGRLPVVLSELESPARVRLEGPSGAHTWVLSSEGRRTRLDQLVELNPTGLRRLWAPLLTWVVRRNLCAATDALTALLERMAATARGHRRCRAMNAVHSF